MNYYLFFGVFLCVLKNVFTTCVDSSMYQLKGKTYLLTPMAKECMSRSEKCIYASANDPDNFRGTISGCMTTVLQFLSNVSFHSIFDNNTFIEESELFNIYINECNDKGIVNKNFTSTTGTLSLYLSCFSQDTKFEDPNKLSLEPITRDISPVKCSYPWTEEENKEYIGFDLGPEKDYTCNEGYCSIFKMSIYNFTSKEFSNFSRFGCLSDLYYTLDDLGSTLFSSPDPLEDFKKYNIAGASLACRQRNPVMYSKRADDTAYIWYSNCYSPSDKIEIRHLKKAFETLININVYKNKNPPKIVSFTKGTSIKGSFPSFISIFSLFLLTFSYYLL
uniref:CUB domain-containing protein n=1 Tax=Strongyloides papillosus TaxID=174720 RepID=A0A0N5BYW8_STREA